MPRPSTTSRVRRRHLLASLAALGTAGVGTANARIESSAPAARTASDGSTARTTSRREGTESTLEPTGALDLQGVAEVVVDDDGETAYCSLVDGFGVVDASDPANPTVLYEERGLTHDGEGPMESIMDVKVSGDRLLVSGPNGYGGSLSGFFLYDVSDPANPERVAFHGTSFGPHNSYIDGEFVYLTGSGESGSPTVIYDVRDDDPEEVARWKAADADDAWAEAGRNYRQTHDVYVQDDVLYVAYWDAGTWLVDVSDPTDPSAIARLGGHDPEYLAGLGQIDPEFRELPGNSHYVQPNADASALFVGKEAWDAEETDRDGGPGGIECWDLSGSEPALRTVLRPPEPGPDEDEDAQWTSHNFGIDGDRLYTSWYGGGVRVYDVGDLANPRLLGGWRDPETTAFWAAKPVESGFVAASYADPRNSREEQRAGEGARFYVFPEPDGEDAEPARTMERRAFPDLEDDGGEGAGTTTTDPTTAPDTSTASDTSTDPGTVTTGGTGGATTDGDGGATADGGGETTTSTGDGTTVADDSGSIPGFGALTAIAGGGFGLWRLLGNDTDGDGHGSDGEGADDA
ncbi:hypothetical protein G9C85_17385 [Halorubellus sp. JP-L1]|uniref:LVIVD repeat-containing protein n=1 Tax=Halorubellus sp. JP-L1 TaxID=2715753 RepID=UPI001407DFB7|nr:hypothetical protein [Halorubellus sp. JP-L1]NHN43393.1 hypothetical protein [Halorubellus sp. JP-L1]